MKKHQAVLFACLWAGLLLLVVSIEFLIQERIYHYFRLDREAKGTLLTILSSANEVLRFPISEVPGITYDDLNFGQRSVRYFLVATSSAFLWAIALLILKWLVQRFITGISTLAEFVFIIASVVYGLLGFFVMFPFFPDEATVPAYDGPDSLLIAASLLLCAILLILKARAVRNALAKAERTGSPNQAL